MRLSAPTLLVLGVSARVSYCQAGVQKCEHLHGGGWVRVRHVPAGSNWHPASDNLAGTEVYGTEGVDDDPWSVKFSSKFPEGCSYDQFLFASGDCTKWLVATPDAVNGANYAGEARQIVASSESESSYTASWYNRGGASEDPWISIIDHGAAIEENKIVYAEASTGLHSSSLLNDGADVYVRSESPCASSQAMRCEHLHGGGWVRVRHVPAGSNWHPASDNLAGTDVYGTEGVDDDPWSVKFSSKFPQDCSYDQFLFASGDCTKWLVATPDAVNGANYAGEARQIVASSESESSYTASWYNRGGASEDPWISTIDHGAATVENKIVYAEASTGLHSSSLLNGGADAYVRNESPSASCQAMRCEHLHGGGWVRVRHVPAGSNWHPASDNLAGTEVYGTEGVDDDPWSVKFLSKFPEGCSYDQFLFASGDCTKCKWLVATPDAVNGANYAGEARQIVASSESESSYTASWYNRGGASEDPWISIIDHGAAIAENKIVYAEASTGLHSSSLLNDGADVYVRSESPSASCQAMRCEHLHGGGWVRVRHVPAGSNWHPASDNLAGTDVYGTEGVDDDPWSVKFSSKFPQGCSYDQFLFASGDCTKWLVATPDAVNGANYAGEARQIVASSESESSYTASWYNRGGASEDPWISIIDHGAATAENKIVYAEASIGLHSSSLLNDGADVYVRSESPSASCQAMRCEHLHGGGWVRVRHVPAGSNWHPASDNLAGTDVYGTEGVDDDPWSVKFSSKFPQGCSYDQFLFASGDCTKWLVATPDAVNGANYAGEARQIVASSESESSYTASWYNRGGASEDPWISIIDHGAATAENKIVYAEASIGLHSSSLLNDGADVYVRSESPSASCQAMRCEHLHGGGWVRVRHVPAGSNWHPASDNLAGTEVYGTEGVDDDPWSVKFSSKFPEGCSYDQFLFASGDCTKWLVATPDAVNGANYAGEARQIVASSESESSYTASWYNRGGASEDPWISIIDHGAAIAENKIVYAEASTGLHSSSLLNDGADVYVRSESGSCQCDHSHGGGWVRVRHVPAGSNWHPASDNLAGTEVYGTEGVDDDPWSVKFLSKFPQGCSYDQFLLASGDCTKWLVATPDAVNGANYAGEARQIVASSESESSYTASWYNRGGASEDPWISIIDHGAAIAENKIVYAEASTGLHSSSLLNGGADVYVRSESVSCQPNSATDPPTHSSGSGSGLDSPTNSPALLVLGVSARVSGLDTPTNSPTSAIKSWDLLFHSFSSNFTRGSESEITLNYNIGIGRDYNVELLAKGCDGKITGGNVSLNFSTSSIENDPSNEQLQVFVDVQKDSIAVEGSNIWNPGTDNLEFCVIVQLTSEATGDVKVIKELQRNIGINFDFEVAFNAENDVEFDKISLGFDQTNANIENYIEACTCGGISEACNTNILRVNDFLNICIKSLDSEMKIDYLQSLQMAQGSDNMFVIVEDKGLKDSSISSKSKSKNPDESEIHVASIIPASFFSYESANSAEVSGVVFLKLSGSRRRLAVEIADSTSTGARALQSSGSGDQESSFSVEVQLEKNEFEFDLDSNGAIHVMNGFIDVAAAIVAVATAAVMLW